MDDQSRSKRNRPPSMYDVARLAGVSQTTVSFVVNNVTSAAISQETRDRVWAAIHALGWRPNAMARSLRTRHSQTLGLISDEVVTSPYAVRIILGAQEAAWAGQQMLLVVNTSGQRDIEQTALQFMLERRVEGLMYAAMYHHEVTPPPELTQAPVVLVNCFVADRSLPAIVPDEVQGGYTATEALIRRGHRRIAFINEIIPMPALFGRLEGYRQALAAYGLPFDPALVQSCHSNAHDAFAAALALLERDDRPTAIFCFNDKMAMGAYDAIKRLGLRIPHDVAVIGFDNLELIAAQLYPPLTTVELPHYEMGRRAVELLQTLPAGESLPPVQHYLPCPLIERESI
ncbi:LacI family transcriptional regulator [Chloroflexus islandicus]|uniref:LacI family transcriptional regulator n=1 Tax=Chloroflexus islandicus TaxID=1707952 RepID=A0A178M6G1_9CHLR|nr:LacI family DNA-binding transcriptional regulator [Chloroflexus islandicus]OAN43638.1 LacI family transcriptional regulator [Chloroflexus islandicus]